MKKVWTILIVEPDPRLHQLMKTSFPAGPTHVVSATTAEQALRLLTKGKIDLVVSEARLPQTDDFAFLVSLRQLTQIPTVIVSSLTEDTQRIKGFELGADDYLPKPFNQRELWLRSARLLTLFYEASPFKQIGQHDVFSFMTVDRGRQTLMINHKEVKLTPRECELLLYLIDHQEEVISRRECLEKVWGYKYFGEERTVDVHIRKLRQKMGQYSRVAPDSIVTVWQRGYRFTAQPKK